MSIATTPDRELLKSFFGDLHDWEQVMIKITYNKKHAVKTDWHFCNNCFSMSVFE